MTRPEPRTEAEAATTPPPSPPWYGGVAIALIFVMVAVLLSYTLLDWDWQQDLGLWNYGAVALLVVVSSVMMRRWRPDVRRLD